MNWYRSETQSRQRAHLIGTMNKRLYIETVGCQMNVLDSEMVVASLKQRGYELVQIGNPIAPTSTFDRHYEQAIVYRDSGLPDERAGQRNGCRQFETAGI